MTYKLAIFDFDGTLADSFPWFAENVNQMAERHGFKPIEAHEVDTLRRLDARRIVAHLQVPLWKMPLIAADMRRRMAADITSIRLFDGTGPMLRQLADHGVAIAILTSNSEANVRRVLGPALAALVGRYVCGASLFGKRAKLRRLLEDGAYARTEVIYIGDELRDLEAARLEGVPFGGVTWGYTTADALAAAAPDVLFTTPEAMAAHLTGG